MYIEDFETEYHLDFLFPSISGNYHLKWAIGETGRTSFVWTLAPPGTHFLVDYKINGKIESQRHISEDYFFSIFRWSNNLDSTLSIKIDDDFISFLRDGHSRKDYNRYYYGKDQENKWSKRPIPLGNHVISVCTAAGFLCEKPKGRFTLRADLLEKAEWQQMDAVIEEFQQYLEKVQVPRYEIEQHPRYEEKCSQFLEKIFRKVQSKRQAAQKNGGTK